MEHQLTRGLPHRGSVRPLKRGSGGADAVGMPSPALKLARASRRPHLPALATALLLFAVPAHGAWLAASVGSWMIVEAWKHGLGEQRVTRTTTTLLRWSNGLPWFEHIDDQGRRWEDADAGTADESGTAPAGESHDSFVTRQKLTLDHVPIPCRVILNERHSSPWSAHDPVREWVARSKCWQAIDTTLRVRVLKVLDLGTETYFRDGHIEKQPGTSTRLVTTLHEPVRLHGRTYDCWVEITKSLSASGEFAGRTTLWGCEQSPTGWVRRIRETRDPRNGGTARLQEQLVDFRLK